MRAALAVALASCGNGVWSKGLSESRKNAVEAWLFCDECDRGQRDSVAAMGATAVEPLGRVLNKIPDDWQSNLQSRYATAARRAQLTGNDSAMYVQLHLDNFFATVQSRSGLSLADIRTPRAIELLRAAIEDSIASGYRADVVRDLKRALVAATIPPVQGDYQPRTLAFLDTVWVTRAGNVPWDRDETVALTGAPFPDDVFARFRTNDTELGFLAAAVPGAYAFSISNVGPAQDSAAGEIQISSFPAAPTTFIRDLTAGPFPVTILQSFSRATSPPDYVHYYRFAPTANLTVTATAAWNGPAQIDLVWDHCFNRGAGSTSPRRVIGRVLDELGNSIGGVKLTLVGTALAAMSAPTGNFAISNVPPGWSGTVRATRLGFQSQDLVAWEGAGDVVFVIPPQPNVAPVSQVVRLASPSSSSHLVPGGACRLLGVLQSDTTRTPPIVRLRVTSP